MNAPALNFPPELLLRAQGVRVAIFDVDGVLTNGGLYFSAEGEALKRFHTLDGHGIKLLAHAGITPAVISGRDSPALRQRLASLGVRHLRLGAQTKLAAAQNLLDELQAGWPQTAAMGDDWPDLPLLARAVFACAPFDAHAEARARAHYVTAACGGQGAAREFCDLLLVACGRYRPLLEQALADA
ncbi:MAG: 3-deoxy-D-manno-octulosonate 8-phosphate phosphatase [Burkholderiaceae bacterium]|jgi:3-deoxy-D-manno-octulosonate 8-phosphate phosphatase (KDO 8-P phosphatase)|nr:3-deoxy-D-manno-octulosonate 8-phosphate phosphatase [Burkholderiaceae bacterium]